MIKGEGIVMDIDSELLKGTLDDLRRSLAVLLEERKILDAKIEASNARLATWERKLEEVKSGRDREARIPKHKQDRRPKGANKNAINDFLAVRLTGATASAIQKGTGLAWSSVQGTLKRNTTLYVEEDGLWRLHNPPKTDLADRLNGSLINNQLDAVAENPES